MKKTTLIAVLFITALSGPVRIQAQPVDETAKKELIEKLKKEYPLDTCAVSGDKFGGKMGEPIEYLYEESGKPSRLVRFCCKGCIKSFKKEPAKYLKMIDDAVVKKKEASPAAASTAGDGHQH
jgi:hypothetical protein